MYCTQTKRPCYANCQHSTDLQYKGNPLWQQFPHLDRLCGWKCLLNTQPQSITVDIQWKTNQFLPLLLCLADSCWGNKMDFFRGTKQFKCSTFLLFTEDNLLQQSSLRISTISLLVACITSSKRAEWSEAASWYTEHLSDTTNGFGSWAVRWHLCLQKWHSERCYIFSSRWVLEKGSHDIELIETRHLQIIHCSRCWRMAWWLSGWHIHFSPSP